MKICSFDAEIKALQSNLTLEQIRTKEADLRKKVSEILIPELFFQTDIKDFFTGKLMTTTSYYISG